MNPSSGQPLFDRSFANSPASECSTPTHGAWRMSLWPLPRTPGQSGVPMSEPRGLALPAGYTDLLGELKDPVRAARRTALGPSTPG